MQISIALLISLLASVLSPLSAAHPGRLDAKGCHNDRKQVEYHCHSAQTSTQSSATSASAALALEGELKGGAGRVHQIRDFEDAKDILRKQIYSSPENRAAFYSGCSFFLKGKKGIPVWDGCGFQPRKNPNRASRIEWEHIVPAWTIGHQLQCWQRGGRSDCSKSDPYFMMATADLHNLVPAIGEINGDRSNYRFTELGERDFGQYGSVPMFVDFKQRAVQPPTKVKGDIARAYFYMAVTYKLQISRAQHKLFSAWNKQDPVDAWECTRNARIGQVQGNENQFISAACLRAGL